MKANQTEFDARGEPMAAQRARIQHAMEGKAIRRALWAANAEVNMREIALDLAKARLREVVAELRAHEQIEVAP